MNLSRLFNPASIALVGASHSELKLGGVVLKNLLKLKCRASIFPVNPKFSSLMGTRAYPSTDAIKGQIDLAIIIRPASEVNGILEGLAGRTFCALVVSAGFAEAGRPDLQDEIARTARRGGIRLMGPNCMGVYNATAGLDTFILPPERLPRPKPGPVAIVTQSGAVLSLLFEGMVKAGMGVSVTAHYGNAADIDESEIYEYLENDPATKTVISYLESVKDGRRFIRRAKALSEKKPLIVLKAGKGASGQQAAFSHTGRLAGAYEVFHSILAQYGICEAPDLEDLMDGSLALSTQVKISTQVKGAAATGKTGRKKAAAPGKKDVLVLTNGGGAGVLASDECVRQGFEQPGISAQNLANLKKTFPPFYGIGNPLDLTAQGSDGDYVTVLDELAGSYAGFVVIALSAVTGITPALAGMLGDFKKRTGRPLVLHTGQDEVGKELVRLAGNAGIPSFATPERAVRALGKLMERASWQKKK